MTANVDEMPAGREMDSLVACDIFGWTRLGEFPNEQVKSYDWGAPPKPSKDAIQGSSSLHIVPYYSTDIWAAFQVVDELLDGTRTFALECWSLKNDHWQVMFKGKLDEEAARYEQLVWAYAKTRPLAICRAALKVMADED